MSVHCLLLSDVSVLSSYARRQQGILTSLSVRQEAEISQRHLWPPMHAGQRPMPAHFGAPVTSVTTGVTSTADALTSYTLARPAGETGDGSPRSIR